MVAALGCSQSRHPPAIPKNCVSMKKFLPEGLLLIGNDVWFVPSGLTRYRSVLGFVTFVAYTTTRCPAVALKVSLASCPGEVVVAVTAGPSIEIEAVKSDASYS